MTFVNLRVYSHSKGEMSSVLKTEVGIGSELYKELREEAKKSTVMIVPVLDDGVTVDQDAVEAFITPGRRSTPDWTDEMVITAHELFVNSDRKYAGIMLDLYKIHDVEVSENSVKQVLKQELMADVEVGGDLRNQAKAKANSGGTRQKVSEEKKQAIIADMEGGMSGVKAALKHGVHKSAANAYYRAKYGHRR